jgi:hypothetical protein
MRIRYCPKCGKAGLKWDDENGKGYDGLTDQERYERGATTDFSMRYCPRCREWVKAEIGANIDQHKK